MKRTTILIAFLVISVATFAQTKTSWSADPNHSVLGFSVLHMGIADVPGHFNQYDITIESSKEDFSDASIMLKVETNSVDTRVAPRDKHLRSADFFDVEKHTHMTFKSSSVKRVNENSYALKGMLTLKGISKPVTMTLNYRGTIIDEKTGEKTVGIQVLGEFNRSDFDFGSDFPVPLLSDKVQVVANGEFKIKK